MQWLQRLRRPRPEVAVGLAIAGLATAAIDVSDGLLADLGHVLRASGGLGATLDLPAALFSEAAQPWLAESASPLALVAGGDDYRLCFCVARRDAGRLVEVTQGACEPVHIGYVEAEPGLRVSYRGTPLEVEEAGYDHFGGTADAT